jgi:hypothetical protein
MRIDASGGQLATMERRSTQSRFRIAAAALCVIGCVGASYAAPPASLGTPGRGPAVAQNSGTRIHLDLRPPALDSVTNALNSQSFRPHALGLEERSGLNLGADAWQDKPSARMAELARRVHREGLPIARLWENHSALLSLGLNQRGKPGLWIIQKTR